MLGRGEHCIRKLRPANMTEIAHLLVEDFQPGQYCHPALTGELSVSVCIAGTIDATIAVEVCSRLHARIRGTCVSERQPMPLRSDKIGERCQRVPPVIVIKPCEHQHVRSHMSNDL